MSVRANDHKSVGWQTSKFTSIKFITWRSQNICTTQHQKSWSEEKKYYNILLIEKFVVIRTHNNKRNSLNVYKYYLINLLACLHFFFPSSSQLQLFYARQVKMRSKKFCFCFEAEFHQSIEIKRREKEEKKITKHNEMKLIF